MTHAIRVLLALGLAATALSGPASAERAPAPVAIPAFAESAAAAAAQRLPGMIRTARLFDDRWLAAMTAPLAAWHVAPGRAAGDSDSSMGLRFSNTQPVTNEPRRVVAPAQIAGGRLINASLAAPSGGSTHFGEAPFPAPGMRSAGTILAPSSAAAAQPAETGPGTWAMLFAGLLGVGAIVRRRTAL